MRVATLVSTLILGSVLAGCGPSASHLEREQREAAALQQARDEAIRQAEAAVQESREERIRRERWQFATFAASVAAIIMLVIGVALGSGSKPNGPNPL